jgi:hypothetical protein
MGVLPAWADLEPAVPQITERCADAVEAELGGRGAEPFVEDPVVMRRDLAQVGTAGDQVVRARPGAAGHDQPADNPPVLQRQCALLGQRQLGPAAGADPGEEHPRYGGHRVLREHARGDQISPVGRDQGLDVGAARR